MIAPKIHKLAFTVSVLHFIALHVITTSADNGGYVQPSCPPEFRLLNGLCYPINQLPTQYCPEGYYLSNNLCYRINPLPCPDDQTTQAPTVKPPEPMTTTETIETSTWLPEPETTMKPVTTTEYIPETTSVPETTPPPPPHIDEPTQAPTTEPAPAPISLCPTGSILTDDGLCHKVYCTQGEYYEGRCLQPVCPDGTVWRGNSCQPPSYIETILEIENVFHNELNHRPGQVVQDNKNNIVYHTTTSSPRQNLTETTTTARSWTTTRPSNKPKPTATTSSPPPNVIESNPQECCSVVTPRICKRYSAKWVCFNRRFRRCDPIVCQHPIIYLKTPKVVYDPPVLIMPPNPPLRACTVPGCDVGDTVDCSGCAHNVRETCSTYCYRYMCPSNACAFIDQQKYCSLYPGEPGCTKNDGCLWDWCGEKCY